MPSMIVAEKSLAPSVVSVSANVATAALPTTPSVSANVTGDPAVNAGAVAMVNTNGWVKLGSTPLVALVFRRTKHGQTGRNL